MPKVLPDVGKACKLNMLNKILVLSQIQLNSALSPLVVDAEVDSGMVITAYSVRM